MEERNTLLKMEWPALKSAPTLFTNQKIYKKLFIIFPFLVSRLSSSAHSGQSGPERALGERCLFDQHRVNLNIVFPCLDLCSRVHTIRKGKRIRNEPSLQGTKFAENQICEEQQV